MTENQILRPIQVDFIQFIPQDLKTFSGKCRWRPSEGAYYINVTGGAVEARVTDSPWKRQEVLLLCLTGWRGDSLMTVYSAAVWIWSDAAPGGVWAGRRPQVCGGSISAASVYEA